MAKSKELDLINAQKDLVKAQDKSFKLKHDLKMQELEYVRESDRLHHEREMERGRIKSAEIRKTMERKNMQQDFQNYSRR